MMMVRKSKGLGERHQRILEFLQVYQHENKYPPSIREIGEKTGISSTSVVNYYLDQLEKRGLIERDRKISRGVRLAGSNGFVDTLRESGLRIYSANPNDSVANQFAAMPSLHFGWNLLVGITLVRASGIAAVRARRRDGRAPQVDHQSM